MADREDIQELREHARQIRSKVLEMGIRSGGGHLAPGFSNTDILVALYDKILRFDPKNQDWEDRDRFVLSKGHGCMPLYAILADKCFFNESHLDTFCQPGSILGCHADRNLIPGVEVTTGSLGLGLPVAVGMAFAARHYKKNHRIYVLCGDGECQEGTIWESAMYAGSNGFDNLTVIVDNNGYGATARLSDTADVYPLAEKLRAFNFSVREVNGHDFRELLPALRAVPYEKGRPSAIVAHTTKGKGVSIMEEDYARGDPRWHYRQPKTQEEARIARRDLTFPLEENGDLNEQIRSN
ncbi:MAG: transketolase [Nanoarchaeota archaeon]|nr:transketolase [Nanoarchaeota archaeon]MBU1051178.1 transketolase [Nanoarchaeota archaeon]MBU1988267.1 transketolase [Nanoarchaeota archaeon]